MLSGEEILWAEAEGYFPHGVRVSVKSEEAPADRAVRMMLSKLQGQPFKTEFPIEQEDTVVPAALWMQEEQKSQSSPREAWCL